MRFFIVFLMFITLAFAIEGRGITPEKVEKAKPIPSETTTPEATPPPATPPASPIETHKAETPKPVLNPLFEVTKVHMVNTAKHKNYKGNKALEYEEKYWMFGAVTEEQIEAKRGEYYVVTWVNKGEARNIEARFEYRQVNTKDAIRSFSIHHPMAKGANRSQFSIVGGAYKEGGAIQSWRFTLWSGDELIAESKSFIW